MNKYVWGVIDTTPNVSTITRRAYDPIRPFHRFVLRSNHKHLFETNTFQLNLLQSETLVIGPQDKYVKRTNMIISTPSDSRNISGNRISRIDTPGVNKDILSVFDTTSNVLSDTNNVKKFDTSVHRSTTQERNLELSRIEEER